MSNTKPTGQPSLANLIDPELVSAVLDLRSGDHLCLVYDEDPSEQLPAILPFLRQGLIAGEQCVYVADDHTLDDFREALISYGIDVATEEERGSLLLWTRDDWRQPGELESLRKAEQVRAIVADALSKGFTGIRFGVEMTWTLGPDIDAERLRHWEATINTIFTPELPGRIICQYSRKRLSPEVIHAGIVTHPVAVIGPDVCANPFYEGPLILGGRPYGNVTPPPEQVDWLISQLRWAKALDREREQRIKAEAAAAEAERSRILYEQLADLTEKLSESEEDLRDFFENGAVSLHWVAADGTILRANRAELQLLGYEEAEYVGRNITEFHADQDVIQDILGRLHRGEIVHDYPARLICKDGSIMDVLIDSSALWREGRFVHTRCFTRDVTEKKQAEQAMHEAMAIKDQFLGLISHELRTPIATIMGNGMLLLKHRQSLGEEDQNQALADVVSESERLQRIIENLLVLSRMDAGRELGTEPVHLARLTEEAVLAFKKRSTRPIAVRIDGEVPIGCGEEALVLQVLENLLGNAEKYSAPDTAIEVVLTSTQHGDPQVSVLDRGIGFDPTDTEKLFTPFYRSGTATRFASGMGLGLAVCKRILEAQGGSISARARDGGGSEFSFSLPAVREQ
jgi:PAS domain S-box-containing protein